MNRNCFVVYILLNSHKAKLFRALNTSPLTYIIMVIVKNLTYHGESIVKTALNQAYTNDKLGYKII